MPPMIALNETQIVTFGARASLGRAGGTAIHLKSKAGANAWHGAASFFRRGGEWSGLPATARREEAAPGFGRSQFGGALGGPIARDRAFWFASFEPVRQTSLLQIGERDPATRSIRNRLGAAPLATTLALVRGDWRISDRDNLSITYNSERSDGEDLPPLQRTLADAGQRQQFKEAFDQGLVRYTRTLSPTIMTDLSLGFSRMRADAVPAALGTQFDFPGLQAGNPFRVPAMPRHQRWQLLGGVSKVWGTHSLVAGGETQRIDAAYAAGFARAGAIAFAENFASADRNGDGRIDDADLRVVAALRNLSPADAPARVNNTHLAAYLQDDWRIRRSLTLNLGARWQLDTNEKNLRGYDDLNPLLRAFARGARERDGNNLGPRVGFVWALAQDRFVIRGSYGAFFDRIPLQYAALEQLLDGRRQVIASSPAWRNAPGLALLENALENPMIQQSNLELQWEFARNWSARAGYAHSLGTHLMLGRGIGTVFLPAAGGPERIVQYESSGKTKYDALQITLEKRLSRRWHLLANYTFAKSFGYTNGDQLPFFNEMADPARPGLEYGPSPFDQRRRFNLTGEVEFAWGFRAAAVWAVASGVPMDILLPNASARLPFLQRNAGGRLFRTGEDLNRFLAQLNAAGHALPLVDPGARFNDDFQSFDLRVTKRFELGSDIKLEIGGDLFNLFNVTNILGPSTVNYSGFANALIRDSDRPNDPGYLRASGFGRPVTTAGRLFTAGGPRSFQFVAKFSF